MLSPFGKRLLQTYSQMLVSGFDASECKHSGEPLSPQMRADMRDWCDGFEALAREMDLPRTRSTVGRILETTDSISAGDYEQRIRQMEENIRDDLDDLAFQFVPKHRVSFYGHGFGERVDDAFPSARYDAQEAGTCYALGRYAATVFHVVRACEHGLRAMAKAAGVKGQIDLKEWGKLIRGIEEKCAGISKWNDRRQVGNALEFYSGALSDARALKDCWRNVNLHVRKRLPIDESEARKALERGQDFLGRLAFRITEHRSRPLPKRAFSRDPREPSATE
jgi:hypothetical protein